MTNAWDELGTRPQAESYQEALARSLVGKTEAPKTEAEIAAKLVADRERMRRMDELLADDYISVSEQIVVSRSLARQLGFMPHDNSRADDGDGWAGGDD